MQRETHKFAFSHLSANIQSENGTVSRAGWLAGYAFIITPAQPHLPVSKFGREKKSKAKHNKKEAEYDSKTTATTKNKRDL